MAIFPYKPFERHPFEQQSFESQWPPQAQQQPMMGQVNPFVQGQPGAFTYSPPQLDEETKKKILRQALFTAGMSLLASMKPTQLPQPMAANIGQAGLAGLQQYLAAEKEQFDRARDLRATVGGPETFETEYMIEGKPKKVLVNKRTGDVIKVLGDVYKAAPSKMTPGISDVTSIRKEFGSHPVTKIYIEMSRQVKQLRSAYSKIGNNNAVVDQVLITIINKLLDPNSVVREGEYRRTAENLSFINRVKGKLEGYIRGGGGVTNEERKAILDMGMAFAKDAEATYKEFESNYKEMLRDFGIPQHWVITTPKLDLEAKKVKVLTATNPTTGERIKSIDGGKTWQPM